MQNDMIMIHQNNDELYELAGAAWIREIRNNICAQLKNSYNS